MKPFSFVDLFCGGGLGARGAVMAGGRPLAAVDLWQTATDTYRDNFPDANVIAGDVGLIDPKQAVLGKKVDLLLASPECTNHSVAKGAQPRCETSRDTALLTLSWIEALRPDTVLIENVHQMQDWKRYGEFTQGLRDLGYDVQAYKFNSADFGVPQSRNRLYLACTLGREALVPPPRKLIRRSASTILDPQNVWKTSPLFAPYRAARTVERAEKAIAEIGSGQSFILVYYGSDGGGGWQSLDVPLRTITTLDRFALVEMVDGEHRMRMLQPPELLRAMGVDPLVHRLSRGTRRDRVRLCGNGICAPVVRDIISSLHQQAETVQRESLLLAA